MNLEEKIKKYSQIDKVLKSKQEEIQKLRSNKALLTQSILRDYENMNLKEVRIPLEDNKLKAYQYKQSNPLTFTFLKECLHEIIPKEKQVEQIIDFIKSKRTSKIITDLKKSN